MGKETDNAEISAWAHEMRAWMALTTGDYHGVVVAAQHGLEAAPHHGVAVQLAAQEAKAWARIGDRRQTEVALDRGRRLLDSMPYPENLDHHFVVDPTKFDFYAMDCYRHLGDDRIAESLATEVIEASTDFDGTERAPMRIAEARITLGVVAARQGELEQAIQHGERALSNERKSLPSLIMVSRDLTRVLKDRYPNEPATKSYLDELSTISRSPELGRPARSERRIPARQAVIERIEACDGHCLDPHTRRRLRPCQLDHDPPKRSRRPVRRMHNWQQGSVNKQRLPHSFATGLAGRDPARRSRRLTRSSNHACMGAGLTGLAS